MNQITLNDKQFQFNETFLPCLVTGADKSWASYLSVCLISNLIQQGTKIIFFTAFPMAKEELLNQIWDDKTFEVTDNSDIENIPDNKSIIIQSGNKDLWQKVIQNIINIQDYVIFVKNIEEYDRSIPETIGENQNIILSGNIDACSFQKEIAKKKWKSKIIFTAPKIDLDVTIPSLEKYESYFVNENLKWILKIKKTNIR